MDNKIFRKKSLERISSPEQLDQYLKVTRPMSWLVLAGLFLVLGAAALWGFTGKIYTFAKGVGVCAEGETVCFLSVEEAFDVTEGMKVFLETEGSDRSVSGKVLSVKPPLTAAEAVDSVKAGWLEPYLPQWVCPVLVETVEENIVSEEGRSFQAEIILKEQKPVDLLTGR